MKRILNTQGKHEVVIVLLIVVPLMVIGVVWAIMEGGYAIPIEPLTPAASPVSTPVSPTGFTIVEAA